jgi:hypothetical protein
MLMAFSEFDKALESVNAVGRKRGPGLYRRQFSQSRDAWYK